MRKQHVLQAMLTWMLIVCLGTRFVYADTTERPDLNRMVDLHLRLESVEEEVKREAGAEVCIYHIAEMKDLGGEITFVYTDDWADMSWDLSESVPVEKVREMSDLAEENALSGQSKVSDDNGDVVYYDLVQGVYLVTQTDTVERFTTFDPFLVYLPDIEDEHWVYEVTAEPKIVYHVSSGSRDSEPSEETSVPSEETTAPTEETTVPSEETTVTTPPPPPTDDSHDREPTPPPTKLPQTGQLNWPIPVLLLLGCMCMSAGVILRLVGRKEE